ncbi:hypothetical protein N431DRAFT_98751 [Stipitochalara longipes BDJ]|nr:hypothetical protein N431DRAFT_98751 [Stipitochalara longipes BDJ]
MDPNLGMDFPGDNSVTLCSHRIFPWLPSFRLLILLFEHLQQYRTTIPVIQSTSRATQAYTQRIPWNKKSKVYQDLNKDSLRTFSQTDFLYSVSHNRACTSITHFFEKEIKILSFGHQSGNRHLPKPPSHVMRNQQTGLDGFNQISSFHKYSFGYTLHFSTMVFQTDAPPSYIAKATRLSTDFPRMMLFLSRICSPGRHLAQRAVIHVQDSSSSSSRPLSLAQIFIAGCWMWS